MQNISVKISKGKQLKAYLKSGVQGPQGIIGLQGEQGIQGIKGEKGDTGEQGLQGIQGEQGVKGDKGDIGEQGLQGIQGTPGNDGIQGQKGDTGEQGITGDKGDTGDSGVASAVAPLQYVSETKTIQVASGYIIPSNSGDGSKYLADDGSFKTVSIPSGAKIEVGDSKAEISDTGSNGLFSVTTDNVVRMNINEDFHFGDGNTEWTSGNEYKCLFDKSKGAFRAGYITNDNWNNNKRGNYSTAFGYNCRGAGEGSFAAGYNNVAGYYSASFGYNNVNGGEAYGFCCGYGNSIAYNNSFVAGYYNTDGGNFVHVIGNSAKASGSGIALTMACGQINSVGDAQVEKAVMKAVTTNAIQLSMNHDTNIGTQVLGIDIPAKTCMGFTARVSAYKSDYSQSADFELKGQIKRDNSGNTTLVWTNNLDPMKVFYRDDPAWDVIATTDSGLLRLKVTGVVAATVKWVADVTLTEVRI